MSRERPPVVLVMAILNLVIGGVHLLCLCVGGIFVAVLLGAGAGDPLKDISNLMEKEVPGYTTILIGSVISQFLLVIVLIAAGIGLLQMQPWARWASILWGISILLCRVGSLVYTLAVVKPATERVFHELSRRQGPGAPSTNTVASTIGDIIGTLFLGGYAVALIIVMLLPSVSAAFSGRAGRRFDEDDYDGRYDREDDDRGDDDGFRFRPRPGGRNY